MTWFADSRAKLRSGWLFSSPVREEHAGGPAERVVELYDQLKDPVYRYLLCLNVSPETAEDLLHETFLRVHQGLREGRIEDRNLKSFIFRVAHNLAVSGKRRMGELAVDPGTLAALSEARHDGGPADPEGLALREEWLRRVRDTVRSLPQQQQRCLHLRAEGLRYREISEVLKMPIATVAVHLQRAVQRLTEECGE